MSDATSVDIPETMHIEQEQDDAPAGERKLSPREIAMEAIARRAEEQRERELAQAAIYDQDARDAGLTFPADEPEAPAVAEVKLEAVLPAKAPPPAEPAPAPAPAPALRSVNIDGQQWSVTEEQFAQLANLGMITRHALMQQPAPQAPAPVSQQFVDRARIEDTVERLQYGDKTQAVEALQNLIQDVVRNAPQTPVDAAAIVQQSVLAARAQAQQERDRSVIEQEYPEIFADPQRTLLAKLNVDAIRARNQQIGRFQNDLDIYREAGNAVYDALRLSRPGSQADNQPSALQAAPVTVQPRQDVIERKRAAPRTTQVIDRRAVAPETPRPPTGSEIVERMRQQRGQTSLR